VPRRANPARRRSIGCAAGFDSQRPNTRSRRDLLISVGSLYEVSPHRILHGALKAGMIHALFEKRQNSRFHCPAFPD
jgi:hypothetical protein